MKMEVETGKRQLINLSRRAAEMLSNWSRGPATEDLIDKAISLPLRNETEVDNEILAKEIMGIWRMLRTFFPDGTITQQLPWLMSLNYASHSGLLVDTWCGDEKLHVDACFFFVTCTRFVVDRFHSQSGCLLLWVHLSNSRMGWKAGKL